MECSSPLGNLSHPDFCKSLALMKPQSAQYVAAHNRQILKALHDTFGEIRFDTMKTMFAGNKDLPKFLYTEIDRRFFHGAFREHFKRRGCQVRICVDDTCPPIGGTICTVPRKLDNGKIKMVTKIALNSRRMQETFQPHRRKFLGAAWATEAKCILNVLQHEMVHALISCNCRKWGNTNDSIPVPTIQRGDRDQHFVVAQDGQKLLYDASDSPRGHTKLFSLILYNVFRIPFFQIPNDYPKGKVGVRNGERWLVKTHNKKSREVTLLHLQTKETFTFYY